jgi:beta-lactam-binding protein with PASTA domain
MIGRILGQRYEIIERLGGGGMALVYRAQDRLLDRVVAVKIMRPQLSGDDEFVRRFKREAQNAAGLSHPGIVGVYDVGREDDIYYIIQEYVEGRTLKEKIVQEGPLAPKEATAVAITIGEALVYAHGRHIVHRDIKPQNILVSADGRVKVTDFGIARGVTGATLTHTGSVVGSVHYFSPEQARGGYADEKSDIYSLGVVLFEMVTGRVPFDGDTPITVALKHVQDPPPSAREFNPTVPVALDCIIRKAMRKVPVERYQTVEAMLADLRRVGRGELVEDAGDEVDSPTMVMKAVEPLARKGFLTSSRRPAARGARRTVGPGVKTAVAVIAILVLLGTGVKILVDWFDVPTVIVPNVVGRRSTDAEKMLRESRLNYSTIDSLHAPETAGTVIWQEPRPGGQVRAGRTVELKVSLGPEIVVVPDLVGLHIRDAEIKISEAKLVIGNRELKYDKTIKQDYIIAQIPRPATSVRSGEKVDLVISQGSEPGAFSMPDLEGETLANARQRLQQLGLVVGRRGSEPSARPIGTVLSHSPAAGKEIKPGDAVNFIVSRGGFAAVNSLTHSFTVPTDGAAQQMIRVELTDAIGTEVAYQKNHVPGDTVNFSVEWVGVSGSLRTYSNGVLIGDRQLR